MKSVFLLIIVVLILGGCKENFSPNGTYERRLVVYSVMTSDSDTQYVRVYSTTDPHEYDPAKLLSANEIIDAAVTVKSDTLTYTFHDTLLTIKNESGSHAVHAYVNDKLKVKSEQSYTLSVHDNGYPDVSSSFSGIGDGYLLQVNTNVLVNPTVIEDISFDSYFGKNSQSYLLLFTIEYEVQRNGVWIKKTFEVPTAYTDQGKYFPQIQAVGGNLVARKIFAVQSFKQAIDEIRSNPQDTIHFNQAVFTLHQFDSALYTYYSVANNFPGGATLRLDEPDYSNITGGFGVVGVTNTYTRTYPLSQNP